ncbi:hypothetical protein UA08_02421 [Talaromyces atroroseus]|uniref:Major facilitator superfamily (MFS) profile domain-containing protein n=1 Tax=Talaromyces atroroseus TaxID=1441469 RepID=A0A225B7I8_TALAT|nr:hypothetical protein UA08_02421 [Talaromyces atroroseus]OKL61897.1 hypothetical protein UA08_02421 [Talaromyces atroroseus]
MRVYRQGLSDIPEIPEASPIGLEAGSPYAHHGAAPPGTAKPASNQFDGGNSFHETTQGRPHNQGHQNVPWSQRRLALAYISIFLLFFVTSLQQQISNHLIAHTMSTFDKHPLTATNGLISSIIGAVIKLPMSRGSDIWGRVELFTAIVIITITGLIMAATSKTVEVFMVAQTLCWVGYDAISYVLLVAMADISSIKNRAWIFATSTLPHLINAFVGPVAAQRFHERGTWRWAYGLFAIFLPVVCMPASIILFGRRQRVAGAAHEPKTSHRARWKLAQIYLVESDVIGAILLGVTFVMLLLPFSLGIMSQTSSTTPQLPFMLGFGICLFPVFVMWEKFLSQICTVPFHSLLNSTVLGGCLAGGTLFISFFCLDSYFISYIQVVYNLTVSGAGYVCNIYIIGACFFAIFAGIFIRINGKYTKLALIAVTFDLLATGLTILTRQPKKKLWHIILNQVMLSLPGGIMGICGPMAVMTATDHSDVAATLALFSLFTELGAAVGQTIATGMYTYYMPKALEKYLPPDAKSSAKLIYGSLMNQLRYPMLSAVREAIIKAYGDFMRHVCVVGLGFLPITLLSVAMWENINVKKIKEIRLMAV